MVTLYGACDKRNAMKLPLMRIHFSGTAAKMKAFLLPLERAWDMRLQCYKPMPDEAEMLIASPELAAIYLDVPLHLFPPLPLALRLLAPPLVTLSNMSILALLLGLHIYSYRFPFFCSISACAHCLHLFSCFPERQNETSTILEKQTSSQRFKNKYSHAEDINFTSVQFNLIDIYR